MKFTKKLLALCLVVATMISVIPFTFLETSADITGIGAPTDLTYYSLGIDISVYQPYVDFAALKASGCEYVFLRVHNGAGSYDSVFEKHYKAARAVGMKLGVYMFTYATTYAQSSAEAQMLIDYFEKNNMYFEYPIWYDIESSSQFGLSSVNKAALCRGWCETLANANYYPGIYSGTSFFNDLPSDFKCDKWVAHYASNDMYATQFKPTSINYNAQGYCVWQYSYYNYTPSTQKYLFYGVNTTATGSTPVQQLDLDVCYKNYPAIIEANGYNNCKTDEKAMLQKAVDKSLEKRCDSYKDGAITTLRTAYDKAIEVLAKSSATDAEYKSAREALEKAMADTIKIEDGNVISTNKKYTATPGTRGDIFDDDGVRLTDGKKQKSDPGSKAYSGWHSTTEVVVDLGTVQKSNGYVTYLAGGPYGITVPKNGEFTVRIYASENGNDYELVGMTSDVESVGTYGSNWTLLTSSVNSSKVIEARYIKFDIACTTDYKYIWLDEVEVIFDEPKEETGKIYVTGVNKYITSGDCSVFTPDFGEITIGKANHAFTANLVAKWDSELKAYVVKSVAKGDGLSTASITLDDDEILIAAHSWEEEADVPVLGSKANFDAVLSAKVGDIVRLDGIDVANSSCSVVPYITIEEGQHKHTPGKEADCNNPQICTECEKVLVDALGHDDGEVVDGKCDRCGEALGTDNILVIGDVNRSGAIDMMDYVLLKRNYFGTFEFDAEQVVLGDVNKSGAIDMMDYVLLKRAYFGTFTIA